MGKHLPVGRRHGSLRPALGQMVLVNERRATRFRDGSAQLTVCAYCPPGTRMFVREHPKPDGLSSAVRTRVQEKTNRMSTATVQQRLTELWETPHTLRGFLSTVDHKKLGRRYLATAFLFLIIGGLEALTMRLQLASANRGLMDPETYDQLFTMHGVTMIFWYAQPILTGFARSEE